MNIKQPKQETIDVLGMDAIEAAVNSKIEELDNRAAKITTDTLAVQFVKYASLPEVITAKTKIDQLETVETDLHANAEALVVQYEQAPLTTLDEVAYAESLKHAKDEAIAQVIDDQDKADLQYREDKRTAVIAEARATLESGVIAQ